MSNNGNKGGYLIGGLILGAVMGAVAGVLFAPTSGKETRGKIKKVMEENGDILEKAKENLKSGFERVGRLVYQKTSAANENESESDNSEVAA